MDLATRHRLIWILAASFGSPGRLALLASRAGLPVPPSMGVESTFARMSRLVLPAEAEALAEVARDLGCEAAQACLPPGEDELQTIKLLKPQAAVQDEPPRPTGTPAEAPPREGAQAWLVRRVHLSVPTQVQPGQRFEVRLTASSASGPVPGAPDEAPRFEGAGEVQYEFWLEEAFPLEGAAQTGTLAIAADGERSELAFSAVATDPLSEGVDVLVRFFLGGYEVGRARAFLPNAAADSEPRPAAPGAIAIPDTLLR